MTKKTIRERNGGYITLSELEGDIDNAIFLFQELKKDGCSGLDYDRHRYDDSYVLYPYITREETDEEYNSRLEAEENRKEIHRAKRREQYERLRQEFGDLT